MHLFLKLTNLIANNCIKLLLLTSEQNLCEMALVKNAARNGAVCYHHDSKEFFLLLCLFLPQGPTLYLGHYTRVRARSPPPKTPFSSKILRQMEPPITGKSNIKPLIRKEATTP